GGEDRAHRAVGDDVAIPQHVFATRGRGPNLVVVEPRAQRVDDGDRLQEVDVPDADGQLRHDWRVPAPPVLPVRGGACYSYPVLTFASHAHRQHHPRQPFHDREGLMAPPEVPERAERIRAAIDSAGLGAVCPSDPHGLEPILRVHTERYVEFLEHAHARWRAATGAPADGEAVPYARAIRGQPLDAPRPVIADLGWYSHDNDAILAGTWAAAIGAVDVTLSAWKAVADGRTTAAYALARPPGHHAAADSYAGYCFLNNAAVAAQAWSHRGARV